MQHIGCCLCARVLRDIVVGEMQKIWRMLVWLSRIGRCRGFGIQSPWAYRMVRYVINEHWPYYAYEELHRCYPSLDAVERKLCKLSLRLSNNVQPSLIVNMCGEGLASGEYLRAGCRKAVYREVPDDMSLDGFRQLLDDNGGVKLIRLIPRGSIGDIFDCACEKLNDGSVIMLTGIAYDSRARLLWRKAVGELPGVVTFDLYYCGLIFFDGKRFKQNYIINF